MAKTPATLSTSMIFFSFIFDFANKTDFKIFSFFFLSTMNRIDFGQSFNPKPHFLMGDGDGTVNRRSLIGCRHWKNSPVQGNHKIYEHEFPGVEHYNMLSNAAPINYIVERLTGMADYPRFDEISSNNHTMKIRFF